MTQRIYDAFREHETVSSAELGLAAMRDKGVDPDNDPETRKDFVRRFGLQLNNMQCEGKIERIGRGKHLRWKLISV